MYDVAIIGGGPAAIFAAYEFVLKYPQMKVIMLEAGNAIEKRFCPLAAKKVDHCINCNPTGCKLSCRAFCHADDSCFGCRIVCLSCIS